jgi:hypothetical protein
LLLCGRGRTAGNHAEKDEGAAVQDHVSHKISVVSVMNVRRYLKPIAELSTMEMCGIAWIGKGA